MSETLLERIALALCLAAGHDPDIVAPEGEGDLMWQTYLPLARAAIEAMRTPTPAMLIAGRKSKALPVSMIWEAMLDAALSEGGADGHDT